ncbi:MAG: helix-turn-helix domain-containing protein [Oscillospiraceae bacterium]|nr:helix-turn-helix domain-containing protein [Oscillospiraceae bacterium]
MRSRYQTQEKVALNVSEAAELLGLSRTTVYELIHREDFPAFKIGARTVIPRKKLEEWANSQEKNFV